MVGPPSKADSSFLPARLQPRSQSGRVAQSGRQDQRRWAEAPPQQNGDGGKREKLLVEHPASTQKSESLLPSPKSPLRRMKCKTFSAPLNNLGHNLSIGETRVTRLNQTSYRGHQRGTPNTFT